MKRRGHLYREAFAGVLAIAAIVTNLVSWEGEPLELELELVPAGMSAAIANW